MASILFELLIVQKRGLVPPISEPFKAFEKDGRDHIEATHIEYPEPAP
jgi:hypothetical protein